MRKATMSSKLKIFADSPKPSMGPYLLVLIGLPIGMVAIVLVLGFIFARNAVTSALLFIVILLGLVMAHESAHFLTAKAFGVAVHEFGFGFPPQIVDFNT